MEVIQGAPGATGPVLNHYNEAAVKKYLTKMSDTIQEKTRALSHRISVHFFPTAWNWKDQTGAQICRLNFKKEEDMT